MWRVLQEDGDWSLNIYTCWSRKRSFGLTKGKKNCIVREHWKKNNEKKKALKRPLNLQDTV